MDIISNDDLSIYLKTINKQSENLLILNQRAMELDVPPTLMKDISYGLCKALNEYVSELNEMYEID